MEAVTGHHQVVLDQDVRRILEIMQTTIPADRLRAVAEGVRDVGCLIWAHHQHVPVESIRFEAAPLTTSCERRSDAILSGQRPEHAGGDSGAVACAPAQ
jgi:hypothetical protein